MLYNENTLRPHLFKLPDDAVADEVLIPGFRSAKSVRGAFGWFTAGWIARLAPGLAVYINRTNSAPVEFTVAPTLFPNERLAIEQGVQISADQASEIIADVFINGRIDASALARHALDCLAWMIATNTLRLRIAVPTPTSNYHPKIWLFDDGMNQMLVRGSGNATELGVAGGVEHLDVDVSWIPNSKPRVITGAKILDEWSQGISYGISEVVDLSDAVARKIIRTAPTERPDPNAFQEIRRADTYDQHTRNFHRKLRIPTNLDWKTGTYGYQREAVEHWLRGINPETGVLSMATGSGKTITALICATHSQDTLKDIPFLIVISAPSIPLLMQWKEEVKKFGINPITPSLDGDVDKSLTRLFRALRGGGTHVLIVTNILLCTESFQETIRQQIQGYSTMLISDEVHSLGVASFVRNQPDFFQKRLGLSATPKRQYDADGTSQIFRFFGEIVYEFDLGKAIGFCLTPYRYFVHASTLNEDEITKYERLSRRIGALLSSSESEENETLQTLLNARRRIIETGESKINLLKKVLCHRDPSNLEQTLIYVSAKNPEQFNNVRTILTELEIKWAPVTERETQRPKQLSKTIESFQRGTIQVLLAKKVLDEGIDIPSIREAFIVASSTVEREWIQRRGRVLRTHAGKEWAIIHDFLAFPPADYVRESSGQVLRKVVERELSRAYEFGKYADNAAGEYGVHSNLDKISTAYGLTDRGFSSILTTTGEHFIAPSLPRGKPW